jgi:hypothetical protein
MSSPSLESLSYPIGKFSFPSAPTEAQRSQWIAEIQAAPAGFRAAVSGLTPEQIETPYRPGGWTVRQVIHHVPESHMNAYIRFKLALTENNPTVKPYNENAWAETPDVAATETEVSLTMLSALHQRWVVLLRSMTAADFARGYIHPEFPDRGPIPLSDVLAMYAWHGKHHTAHIAALRQRMGWR